MAGRVAFATLLMLSLGLSGCLGGGEEEDPVQYGVVVAEPVPPPAVPEETAERRNRTPAEGEGEPAGNRTGTEQETADRPPFATVEADRTYGTGPLKVRFRLDGGDPEGGNLTWTFDADGDGKREAHGTSLPINITHTYPLGTWEAVFKVADGNTTRTKRLSIEAVPPAPTGPPAPQRIHGTITGVLIPGVGFLPETQNHTFVLPRSVERMTLSFTTSMAAADLDYELYAPDGRRVGRQAHFNEPTGEIPPPFIGRDEPDMVVSGTDANRTGTWTVKVMPALAVEGDYLIDITFA